jgi:hypothetical protein
MEPDTKKRKRGELFRLVNADYYGYKDDDDGLLQRQEKKQEIIVRETAVKEWREQQRERTKKRRVALGLEGSGDEEVSSFPPSFLVLFSCSCFLLFYYLILSLLSLRCALFSLLSL